MDGELSVRLEGSNCADELLCERLRSYPSCVVLVTMAENPRFEMRASDPAISHKSEPILPQMSLKLVRDKNQDIRVSPDCVQMR